jgi:CheY-like chemotaxis protein
MKHQILIIDDNLASAEALAAVLDMVGHGAEIANGAFEGLLAVTALQPRLVFLDLGMPEMNGYQVAACIRADAGLDQPYLIAYSAWGDAGTIKKTAEAGFDRHIAKTTSFESLVSAGKECAHRRLD